jgi:putative heme-binding domain-containing protein
MGLTKPIEPETGFALVSRWADFPFTNGSSFVEHRIKANKNARAPSQTMPTSQPTLSPVFVGLLCRVSLRYLCFLLFNKSRTIPNDLRAYGVPPSGGQSFVSFSVAPSPCACAALRNSLYSEFQMMRRLSFAVCAILLGLSALSAIAQNTNVFEFRDGDRVVLIGDTFIEREQSYGYIEHILTTHHPDRNVLFRNLGWSADTPLGVSRAGFDPPEKGFDRVKEQIEAYKPTVAFLFYGMASSFDGEAGLPRFKEEMKQLMDAITKSAGNEVRFVIISPMRHEKLPPPLPDPTKHNGQLAAYTKALQDIARERNTHFVNLFESLDNTKFPAPYEPLTDNGIHLTAYGYRRAAESIAMGLGWESHIWRFGITSDGKIRDGSYGTKILEHSKQLDRAQVTSQDFQLVHPPWVDGEAPKPLAAPDNRIQIVGLKVGVYDFKIDGKLIRRMTDRDLSGSGHALEEGPQFEQAELLRQTILKKNELFFHRWRPQNNTYLFLFRKHEQGQNAREIPQFDPLVEKEEQKIAVLRQPSKHTFEWVYSADQSPPLTNSVVRKTKKPSSSPVTENPQTPFRPQPVPVFQTDPTIEISLWAENPQLAKPIQINFDARGRLWVASSSVYPQISPGQTADDKILILEDTDGDHKADKTTVFAENLLIPTAVEPGDGGVYVGQSTELLHFKDTDDDGMADHKRIVLSGFGTEDTHHTLHTLRWGFDGQLYMNQSIYIHSHIETPHGVVRLDSGGILNLRPPTMELEIFMKGLVNGWGHHFDRFGQSFATDGAGSGGINYVVPGAMYVTYEGARRILGSVSPGSYPKFCSLEVLHSEHFPADWQGNMITCDFRANRVVRFSIEEQGSAYTTKEMPLLIRTTNTTFRPIDVKLGPDGALYIADWSNPIIQHGEVDFRDPRRDRLHGRIWRVAKKGGAALTAPKFADAKNTELLDHLLSPNGYVRHHAKRILTERATNVLNDLKAWTAAQKTDSARLEALWMYQAVDVTELTLLGQLLKSEDGRIRAAATRVLGFWHKRIPQPMDLLAERIADQHPRVRLEAARALSRIPTIRAAELVLSAVEMPMDKHLDYALWLSINDLAKPWLEAIESGAWKPEGRQKQLEFGLKAIEPELATRALAKVITTIPRDGSGGAIELIGQAGGPPQLRQLLDQLLSNGLTDNAAPRALTALTEAARVRNARPDGELAGILPLAQSENEKIRAGAIRLAGIWKLKAATPTLLKVAGDNAAPKNVRQAAFEGLREIGGKEAIEGLRKLAGQGNDLAIRQQAAIALAANDLNASMPQITGVLRDIASEDDALTLWRALLNIKNAPAAFTRGLAKETLPEPVARAGVRVAREGGRNEPDLVLTLNRAGSLSSEAPITDEEIHQIAYVVTKGDPVRGETIYRRKELGCVLCHAIGGAGGKVGPDMTSLGASAVTDYVVEAVLAPNKKVKEGYHSIQLVTKDGQELSGTLMRETNEELILRDVTNKEISVPKKNVESRKIGGSLMPAGLVDLLSPAERIDLFRFLIELGKPGPFDASKANVARAWRVNNTSTGTNDPEILKSDLRTWVPLYTTVSGALPKDDLKAEQGEKRLPLFLAARFQTAKSGPVKLKLTGVGSPKAWLDGKPVGGDSEVIADLAAGAHTFVVKVNVNDVTEYLRLESPDVTFLVD